jgi:predicted RNase H-like HicB family nuclease
MQHEIVIRLEGVSREDGSVFITSPDIKLFSAVGQNEEEAVDAAVSILAMLIEDKWEIVEHLRRRPASALQGLGESHTDQILPAHVIAMVSGERHGSRGSTSSS